MPFFSFNQDSPNSDTDYLGRVRSVDTRRLAVDAEDGHLERVGVGKLVALPVPGPMDDWLIGIVERIARQSVTPEADRTSEGADTEETTNAADLQGDLIQGNTVSVTLVGTVRRSTGTTDDDTHSFSRSLVHLPDIHRECYVLRQTALESFMGLLVRAGDTERALEIGSYTLDPRAKAYLDGDKFFQRHAALLGSTGSGKSWTVARILERASSLPSSNLIVFDLHGEYRDLSYADQLRIPGPDDLGSSSDGTLYLPYWLMNAEELIAMFIDSTEFTAHNQTLVFQDTVVREKTTRLESEGRTEVLNSFTVDSPVPFDLQAVIGEIRRLNEEMVQGQRGLKKGDFNGQFSRLLARIRTKLNDRRYGFLFQAPDSWHTYEAFHTLATQLLDFTDDKKGIKVIDFSEVPADVLPVMLGIVARMIHFLQFWTPDDLRHPVALVCDEAHLYLPRDKGNPNQQRAVANFEKIAKEGRKYGVGLLIVSQRPSDVSTTILSQCNNVMALRLTNSDDQNVVKRLMPETLGSFLEMLPILDIGEALVVGDAVLLPSRIKVEEPIEKPLSATIDFWTEWSKPDLESDWVLSAENMRRQRRRSS